MYGCELLFTAEAAQKIRAEIILRTGSCPCDTGQRCPLLPADLAPLMVARAPGALGVKALPLAV